MQAGLGSGNTTVVALAKFTSQRAVQMVNEQLEEWFSECGPYPLAFPFIFMCLWNLVFSIDPGFNF